MSSTRQSKDKIKSMTAKTTQIFFTPNRLFTIQWLSFLLSL